MLAATHTYVPVSVFLVFEIVSFPPRTCQEKINKKNTRDNRESVWYKVLSTVTAAGKCELVSVRGSCKRVLKSAPWGVTHRDPVIFEIKASFIFPPEGGGLGMPARRLTLETGSLPDCHNHILWVLSEVIA